MPTRPDPSTDPDHDLTEFPQDPQARQPGERLAHWWARRCSPQDDAPPQDGDQLDGERPREAQREHGPE